LAVHILLLCRLFESLSGSYKRKDRLQVDGDGLRRILGGSAASAEGDAEAGSWRELLRLIGVAEAMEIS
jgi:hypothetical protein